MTTSTRKSRSTRTTPKAIEPTEANAIRAYVDAKAKGTGNKEARANADAIKKVNPSKLNRAWYADTRNPTHVAPDATFPTLTEAQQNAMIVVWRAEQLLSWGQISILAGWISENAARNRFERTSGVSSTGHRTGQGGRFAFGTPELYVGNHKGLGTETTPEELKVLRADAKALAEYMKAADEYQSLMNKKAAAAKRALKAKAKANAKANA